MRINWVLSEHVALDPLTDIEAMKAVGSFWGSWRTWRAYGTDNVICHDQKRADEFLQRNFQTTCNFYIPNHIYASLARPTSVHLYEGDFKDDTVQSEDIVAMHLTSGISDLVLMLGFDFSEPKKIDDKLLEHRALNYRNLIRQVIIDTPEVQWVVIDHPMEFRKDLQSVANLGKDSLANILS